MSDTKLPDLAKYLDKRVKVRMQGNRMVTGVIRGYDQFMNVVLADAAEEHYNGGNTAMGESLLRGGSIINIELLVA
jgi:small nuclear ribonucleoprotein G